MRTIHKTAPMLHAKALSTGEEPGTFEAIWAVFGNEDIDGDIVESGAFLDSWARKMPKVVWSHSWMEVPIGVTLEVDEITRGTLDTMLPGGVPEEITGAAWAKARLAIDDSVRAREVYAALKLTGGDGRPALDEFSWGGRVTRETIEKRDNAFPIWHIEQVDQTEWGPCLKGANPATALIAAKSGKFDLERALALANGDRPEGVTEADELVARKLRGYRTVSLSDAREMLGLADDGEGTHNPLEQPGREPAQPQPEVPADNPETNPPEAPVQPEKPVLDPEQRARIADLILAN
jgi:hypothetical protein